MKVPRWLVGKRKINPTATTEKRGRRTRHPGIRHLAKSRRFPEGGWLVRYRDDEGMTRRNTFYTEQEAINFQASIRMQRYRKSKEKEVQRVSTAKYPYSPTKGLVAGLGPFNDSFEYSNALEKAKKEKGIVRTRRSPRPGNKAPRSSQNGSLTFRQRLLIFEEMVEAGVGRSKAIEVIDRL